MQNSNMHSRQPTSRSTSHGTIIVDTAVWECDSTASTRQSLAQQYALPEIRSEEHAPSEAARTVHADSYTTHLVLPKATCPVRHCYKFSMPGGALVGWMKEGRLGNMFGLKKLRMASSHSLGPSRFIMASTSYTTRSTSLPNSGCTHMP